MSYFTLFILCSITFKERIVLAQQVISVEYKEIYAQPQYISNGTPIFKLIMYPNYSVYFKSDFIKNNLPFFSENEPDENFKKANDYLFKFFKEQKILSLSNKIGNKYFIVSDSIPLVKWKVLKTKPIRYLGLDCYQAQGHFRGRHYTAYFAPKIRNPDGPFKFCGLPGLIIKIVSDDHFKIFQAIKINYHEKEIMSVPEKFREKPISFQNYASLQKMADKKFIQEDKARYHLKPGETREVYFEYLEKTIELE
ncbi:GLPGLI family protein [Aquirufa ecclesiirivi]|uniref:GLPGLI family protein n=1 Tax=Aquirufa ecclesiirivi TaxID=2715124 RepID=UPI0022A8BBDB|nr:GLPGLI family protein [Aquirufa ecclesiirivi]MCZ2473533.1 GLPGLI family protein [Aquirufa ecclesiirivi]